MKSLQGFKTVAVIAGLLLAGLACSLTQAAPVAEEKADPRATGTALQGTLSALKKTLAAAEPLPERPQHLIQPGYYVLVEGQPRAWVWAAPDGCLAIWKAGSPLVQSGACLPGSSENLAWRAQRWLGWGPRQVSLPEPEQNRLAILSADGSVTRVTGPTTTQPLVDARLSPDGAYIYWLYDVTRVPPDPVAANPCDAEAGCVGREYAHFLTDGQGSHPVMVGTITVNSQNFPRLEIAAWQSDSAAVFIRRNANIPSRYYPDAGGAITRVNVPYGSSDSLSEEYLSYNTQFSPSGTWQVDRNHVDGKTALRMQSGAGKRIEIPLDGSYSPLVFQVTFSSDEQWACWIALHQDGKNGLSSVQLTRLALNGSTRPEVLWESDEVNEDDLPYISAVIDSRWVMINGGGPARIFMLEDRQWLQLPEMQGAGWALLGSLAP